MNQQIENQESFDVNSLPEDVESDESEESTEIEEKTIAPPKETTPKAKPIEIEEKTPPKEDPKDDTKYKPGDTLEFDF